MLLGLPVFVAASATAHAALPATATLLVAGPDQGSTARWADLIAPPLAAALAPGLQLSRESIGGADGVTAANQFQARAAADGSTALLLPGTAALAWLVGDPRARFNPAEWVTALAGTTPVLLASRLPLAALGRGRPVRVAGATVAAALPGLLSLELMGALPELVHDRADGFGVDVRLIHGRNSGEQVRQAARAGLRPILALTNGTAAAPDPDYPALPVIGERLVPHVRRSLVEALDAAIAAVRIDTALVLPPLTPAAKVALWRRAGAQAADATPIQDAAAHFGIHPQADAAAVAATAPFAVKAAALLDVRQWLTRRFGWHPG